MRTATRLALALIVFSTHAGCGGDREGGGPACPAGWTFANPDGRGMRCIRADSSCFDPSSCAGVIDACCTEQCADPEGDSRWACEQTCRVPGCRSSDDCEAGERCEVYSECSAACVPDQPCPQGQVMADPDGNGFRCIPADSSCFRPGDCGPSLDVCCDAVCREGELGRFACDEDCVGETDGGFAEEDRAPEPWWECHRDADCVVAHGEGWTCSDCPGNCLPPAGTCYASSDCVVAIRENCCCPCPDAYAQAEVAADPCTVRWGEAFPPECACEMGCDMECVECVAPVGVECIDNDCVAIWE